MENKSQILDNFDEIIKGKINNPEEFFAEINNSEDVFFYFGKILSKGEDYNILKETLTRINRYKVNKNLDDLIDFLMREDFTICEKSEIISLKTLCINTLSGYKSKKSIPALLYCLNNKNANYKLRFLAAEALGKIGDNNAVESLINVVSDEDEKSVYVRESAATALGMIGDMRAVDPFLNILEAKKSFLDKFTFLKERVIEALSKINLSESERIFHAFKNALDDESAQVRINAVEGLMNIGSNEAYEAIKAKLYDNDEEVVKNTVIAMYNIKGKEALFEILKDEKAPVAAKNEADNIYAEYEEE